MNARGTLKVVLVGRGPLTLRASDYLATGGEGSVYRAKGTVVKLYTDQAKMRREGTDQKLALLSRLSHPYIVAPSGLVTNEHGEPRGYYMPHVNGEALSRVFTTSYWQREGFSLTDANGLVAHMRAVVEYAHGKQALLVDANELNWLVVRGKEYEPRVIDVDSWAIGKWPASVIMPSIQDHHTKGFNEGTDWFAWGVVSFQVYTGIHPYKGTLPGYGRGDLARRMRENASVFRSDVRLNKAVRDVGTIPGPLLDWYRAVFEAGERIAPPSPHQTGVPQAPLLRTKRVVTTAQGALIYTRLRARGGDPVVAVYPSGYAHLRSGALVSLASGKELLPQVSPDAAVVVREGALMVGEPQHDRVLVRCVGVDEQVKECTVPLAASMVVSGNGRLFGITARGLQELAIRRVGARYVGAVGAEWPLLPQATNWFAGVGVMDGLGAMYLVVPFGERGIAIARVQELDRYRVLAATAAGRIAVVLALSQAGEYVRMEFVFDASMQQHSVRTEVVQSAELNAVVLEKGVVARIDTDGELVISVPTTGVVNMVHDKDIATDMQLARWGDRVIYLKDGAVWSLAMK